MEAHMKKFFLLEELFFSSKLDPDSKNLVSDILENLNCLSEDYSKIILSHIPDECEIEEIIDSLILGSETFAEMKNKLSIVKNLNLLDLREENALANRLLGEIGFSEEIDTVISIEDAVESEEQIAEIIETEE